MAASALPGAWEDPDQFSLLLHRTEGNLNCSLATGAEGAPWPTGALAPRSAAPATCQRGNDPTPPFGYNPEVNYCGPGDSTTQPLLFEPLRYVDECLNEACYQHDRCYGSHCISKLYCDFSDQTPDCDTNLQAACTSGCLTCLDGDLRGKVVCEIVENLLKVTDHPGCPASPCSADRHCDASTGLCLGATPNVADIPGAPIAVGNLVQGGVDHATLPNAVYAISLTAGEEVTLLSPDSTSIKFAATFHAVADHYVCDSQPSFSYVPAVTGTYYLWVTTTASGDEFNLHVSFTGLVFLDNSTADLRGAPLMSLGTTSGVVDTVTKPSSVHAVSLQAGKEVAFSFARHNGYYCNEMEVRLLSPNSTSNRFPATYHVVADHYVCDSNPSFLYVPATTKTYYLWVTTTANGDAFDVDYAATGITYPDAGTADVTGAPAVSLGTSGGVVDSITRPNALYALPLTAGHEVAFQVARRNGYYCNEMEVRLLSPDSSSIHFPSTYHVVADHYVCDSNSSFLYVPTDTKKYFLWFTTTAKGDAFSFDVSETAFTFPDDGAPDIAGAPLHGIGMSAGVVDATTKPDDLYAFSLQAGQESAFSFARRNGYYCNEMYVRLLSPKAPSPSIGLASTYDVVANGYVCDGSATLMYQAAKTGLYYLWVTTTAHGDAFGLDVEQVTP
jgi:hypothetical protein